MKAAAFLIEFAVFTHGGFFLQGPVAMSEFRTGKLRVYGLSFVFHSLRSFSHSAGDSLFQRAGSLKPGGTNVIIILQGSLIGPKELSE
jgi:hypothetical protein